MSEELVHHTLNYQTGLGFNHKQCPECKKDREGQLSALQSRLSDTEAKLKESEFQLHEIKTFPAEPLDINGNPAIKLMMDKIQSLEASNDRMRKALEGLSCWKCYHCFEDCPCKTFIKTAKEALLGLGVPISEKYWGKFKNQLREFLVNCNHPDPEIFLNGFCKFTVQALTSPAPAEKVGMEEFIMRIANDHYWDSLQNDKGIVLKHLEFIVQEARRAVIEKLEKAGYMTHKWGCAEGVNVVTPCDCGYRSLKKSLTGGA